MTDPDSDAANAPVKASPWPAGVWPLALAVGLGSALVLGFVRMYSTFPWYDDDGYLLITIRSFLDGHPLYEQTYTNYGPFYYLWRSLLHGVCGLPVSHDATRVIALAEWCFCGVMGALLVKRMTGSTPFSVASGVLLFLFLEPVTKEASHPQLLALGLTLASVWVFTPVSRSSFRLILTGALLGALAAIKPNLGLFAVLGIVLVQSRNLGLWALMGAALAGAVLPLFVMRMGFREPTVTCYAVTASLAAIAFGLDRRGASTGQRKEAIRALAWIVSGAALAYAMSSAFALATGTSLSAWWDGVFVRPMRFAGSFVSPKPFGLPSVLLATLAAGFAGWRSWSTKGRAFQPDVGAGLGVVVLIIISLGFLITGCTPLTEGGETRAFAAAILGLGTPWAFLLRPSPGAETTQASRTRETLVALAVTHMAIGFPVAGTQLSCGASLFVLAALGAGYQGIHRHFGRTAPTTWSTALVVAASVFPMLCAVRTFRSYDPLSLPGAQWLRLEPQLVGQLHSTVDTLRTNGSPFLTVFGMNSLYLWTEMTPPTSANATLWPWMLSEAEQTAIVSALERDKQSAVLVISGGDYLSGEATNHLLGRWILDRTSPREEVGIARWPLRKQDKR